METNVLEELHKRHSSGSFPVLIDIYHDRILWDSASLKKGFENGHLRIINDTRGVVYKGKTYLPSVFSYSPPSEDGKAEASASITVSAVDRKMLTVIENMHGSGTATITTIFEKISVNEVVFTPIKTVVFETGNVEWDKLTAKWKLSRDPITVLNVPRDIGTKQRCPSAY